jgi:methanogenic corrinoid protein MtbC1
MNEILREISDSILNLKERETLELTKQAVAARIPAPEILNDGLLNGFLGVGERWQKQEYFISHVLFAANILGQGNAILEEILVDRDRPKNGVVVIGTPQGDIHDIGKNLVIMMLKANNFEVIDLGVDVPPEKFIQEAKRADADIIACSIIMSVVLPVIERIVSLAHAEGLWPKAKIIVGGAPITEAVAKRVGADNWAATAPEAGKLALALVGKGGA